MPRPAAPTRRLRLPRPAALLSLLLAALLGACALEPPGSGGQTASVFGSFGGFGRGSRSAPDGALPGEPADPARLRGLAASEVVAKLGDPSYRRREAPAEIWQYYGQGCVLDLFLYEEKGVKTVAHYELRNQSASPAAANGCLSGLLAGKRQQDS